MLPLAYLLIRAWDADFDKLADLLWRGNRWRQNLDLLKNTVLLAVAVLGVVSVLAFPAAWLTGRYQFPGRRLFTVLLVLPLAIPGYLMAFTLLAVGGPLGSSAQVIGIKIPVIKGFAGSLIALSAYLFPYLFLSLRASVMRLDVGLEEAAKSLGAGTLRVFSKVILPQLIPGYLAGALLVVLHVIGDFGVVYFMNYETFSYRLFQQFQAFDMVYAACIALVLLGIAGVFIVGETLLLRGLRLQRIGPGTQRAIPAARFKWWIVPVTVLLLGFLFVSVVVPVGTICYWAKQPALYGDEIEVMRALKSSVKVSLPAAFITTLIALPIGFLVVRYPSRLSRLIDRSAYIGYATPALAFALGLGFFALKLELILNTKSIYLSLQMLIYAYSLHFLAEALGPVRSAIATAGRRLEEASHSLGHGPIATFRTVTFPLIRSGVIVGLIFVFLSGMKELPMTVMLQPLDFTTLSYEVWSRIDDDADYAAAARFALAIIMFSSLFVGLILYRREDVQ